MKAYVVVGNEKLYYETFGHGPQLLLAIHGHGQNALVFQEFSTTVQQNFTTISLDMPHHGNSQNWAKSAYLSKPQLQQIVRALLRKFQQEKFSVLAYSMGGRVALCLLEIMPEKIDNMLLIASDGLVPNPWYYLSTRTLFGKQLFQLVLTKNVQLKNVVTYLQRRKLLKPEKAIFFQHYLSHPHLLQQLSLAWPALKKLIPNRNLIRSQLLKHAVPLNLIFGSNDAVIPEGNGRNWSKALTSVYVKTVHAGHHLLQPQFYPLYKELLVTKRDV